MSHDERDGSHTKAFGFASLVVTCEACIPFGYVRGMSPVPLMLMVKIKSYAIGSAFGRGQARGRHVYAGSEP